MDSSLMSFGQNIYGPIFVVYMETSIPWVTTQVIKYIIFTNWEFL